MSETSTPDSHPEFGRLITERKASFGHWVFLLFFVALTIGSLLMLVLGIQKRFFPAASGVPTKPGVAHIPSPPSDDWVPLVIFGSIMSFVFGLIVITLIGSVRTRTRFHEHGVQIVRFGKHVRAMAYADCERLLYSITRQYLNGIYVGTALRIRFKAKGKPTIRWDGAHKEKPKGLSFTVFGKGEFKGEDELDIVKLVAADAMADRWIDRLSAGEKIDWLGQLELAADSLTILRGKRKKQTIPYSDLDRFAVEAGWMKLFHRGDERSCVSLPISAENFWPGMRVMERMWEAAMPADSKCQPSPVT